MEKIKTWIEENPVIVDGLVLGGIVFSLLVLTGGC